MVTKYARRYPSFLSLCGRADGGDHWSANYTNTDPNSSLIDIAALSATVSTVFLAPP